MISLERRADVFLLDLGDGDNRFGADTIERINRSLDEIERADGPAALVTKATGKIWSNGLDLDYMATLDDFVPFVADVQRVMARFSNCRCRRLPRSRATRSRVGRCSHSRTTSA